MNNTITKEQYEKMYKEACKLVKKYKDINKCENEFILDEVLEARKIVFAHDFKDELSKAARRTCEEDS